MRVLVTGGTGFVGSHIAVALKAAGHGVRLLVRRPEQVARTFAPHGVSFEDIAVGDVLDEASVRDAVDGCDAVVHAAAIFSSNVRADDAMLTTNEKATRIVLGAAQDAGAQQIVHISTTVALNGRGPIGDDLPLGDIPQAYARSKVASEAVAREFQAAGARVTCVYPGAVYGPYDPYVGESDRRIFWLLTGAATLFPQGGNHGCDVRDVAAVVTAVLDGKGQAPHRYVVPGHHQTSDLLFDAVNQATGRHRPHVDVPGVMARPAGKLLDLTNRLVSLKHSLPGGEAFEIQLRDASFDTSRTTADLGVTAMAFNQSVQDTVDWLIESGTLSKRYARR